MHLLKECLPALCRTTPRNKAAQNYPKHTRFKNFFFFGGGGGVCVYTQLSGWTDGCNSGCLSRDGATKSDRANKLSLFLSLKITILLF